MAATVDSLMHLAAKFDKDQQPALAIKCLKAAALQHVLPITEAKIRVSIARLYLDHTHNVADAKQELHKAQLICQDLPAMYCLKCEVYSQLGRCYKLLGEIPYMKADYEKALEVCSEGMDSRERADLLHWRCYFSLRLADASMCELRAPETLTYLQQGYELAERECVVHMQVLLLLFKLQMHLMMSDSSAARSTIHHANELLESLQPDHAPLGFIPQAKLHLTILQALFLLRVGQLDQLTAALPHDRHMLAIVSRMESLHVEAALHRWTYEWIGADTAAAAVQLLAASILKAQGKVKRGLLAVSRGERSVEASLAALGLDATAAGGGALSEGQLEAAHIWVVRGPLVLRVLLADTRAQLLLLAARYAEAQEALLAAMQMLVRFPKLLGELRAVLHITAATYARATRCDTHAVAHCRRARALAVSDTYMANMAACCGVLALLAAAGQDPQARAQAVSASVDELSALSSAVASGGTTTLSHTEVAALKLAGALLRLHQGAVEEAKTDLSRALKLAHAKLCNHQMLVQVLNAMAPLQLSGGDAEGALQMGSSSLTFVKGFGDLHSLCNALLVLHHLALQQGDAGGAAAHAAAFRERQEELRQRVQDATSQTQQHTLVLTWDLPQG